MDVAELFQWVDDIGDLAKARKRIADEQRRRTSRTGARRRR